MEFVEEFLFSIIVTIISRSEFIRGERRVGSFPDAMSRKDFQDSLASIGRHHVSFVTIFVYLMYGWL